MRILAVDDDPDITQMLEMIVKSLGHEFDSAYGGREGFEKIRNGAYDLVFLDLSMPDFMGSDVVETLIEHDLMNRQKIVLFTAFYLGTGHLERELQKKGIHSVMTKPADIDQIIDKINEVGKGA